MFARGLSGMPTAAETHEQLELAFTALFNKPCKVEKYRVYTDGSYVCYMVKIKKEGEEERIDVEEIKEELVFTEAKEEEVIKTEEEKQEVKEGGSEMETNQPQTERITTAQFFGEDPVQEPTPEPVPQIPVEETVSVVQLGSQETEPSDAVPAEESPPMVAAEETSAPLPEPDIPSTPESEKPVTLNKDGTPRKQRSDRGVSRGPRKAKVAKKATGKRGRPPTKNGAKKATGKRGRPPTKNSGKQKGKSVKSHVTLNKDGTPRKGRSDKGMLRGPRN